MDDVKDLLLPQLFISFPKSKSTAHVMKEENA